LTNDLITDNWVAGAYGLGGGVDCGYNSSPTLTNDTISGNAANYGGGVYGEYNCSPTIKNTIVAFNTRGGGIDMGDNSCKPVVTYSDVYGNSGGNYVGLPTQTDTGGNLSANPLFAKAAAGDFHLESQGGRWDPASQSWIKDTVTSPCLDAGDPSSIYNQEPAPNGGRIEMGAYGDTPYASKSPTTTGTSALTLSAAAVATTRGSAQIVVTLASAASVEASILNLAGREIAVLPEQELAAGVSTMLWNGRSAMGTQAPAGRYEVRVKARTGDGGQAQALVALELKR
jgi:hypothetical protein